MYLFSFLFYQEEGGLCWIRWSKMKDFLYTETIQIERLVWRWCNVWHEWVNILTGECFHHIFQLLLRPELLAGCELIRFRCDELVHRWGRKRCFQESVTCHLHCRHPPLISSLASVCNFSAFCCASAVSSGIFLTHSSGSCWQCLLPSVLHQSSMQYISSDAIDPDSTFKQSD